MDLRGGSLDGDWSQADLSHCVAQNVCWNSALLKNVTLSGADHQMSDFRRVSSLENVKLDHCLLKGALFGFRALSR